MSQGANQSTVIQSQDNTSSSNSPMRRYIQDKREQKRVKKIFSEHQKNEARQLSVPRFSKDDPTIKELELAKYHLQKYSRELPAYKGLKKQLMSQDIDLKILRVNKQKGNSSHRQSQVEDGFSTYRQRGSQVEAFLKNTRNQSFSLQLEEQLPNVRQSFKGQAVKNYVFDSQTRRHRIEDIIQKLELSKNEIHNKNKGFESPFGQRIQKLKEDRLKSQEREFNIYNSMPFDPTIRKEKRERYLAYRFDPELPYLTSEKFHPKNKINKRYSHLSQEVLEHPNKNKNSNINQQNQQDTHRSTYVNTQKANQSLGNTPMQIPQAQEQSSLQLSKNQQVLQLEHPDDELNLAQAIEDQKFIESVFNSKEASNKRMERILQSNKRIINKINENCNSNGLFDSLKYFSTDKRIQNKELTDMLQQMNSNRERTLQKKRELYSELFTQSAQVSPHKRKQIRDDLNKSLQQILKDNKRQKRIFRDLVSELQNTHKNIPEDILDALDELKNLLKEGKILFPENMIKMQVLLDNYGFKNEPFILIYNALQMLVNFDCAQLTNRSLDSTTVQSSSFQFQ